ncbi:MAG: glycosyltransferase family 9 protein [Candidatus Woesearchaeota archaeon]
MTVKILKSIDKYLLGIIASMIGTFKIHKKNPPSKPKKILFIKLWAIGDSVNTLPLIKKVKESYPQSEITILTKNSLMPIYDQPFIDKIVTTNNVFEIIFSLKKYDVVFDLEPFINISAITSSWLGKYAIGFSDQTRSMTYDYQSKFYKDKHITKTYLEMGKPLHIKNTIDSLINLNYSKRNEENAKKILEQHLRVSGKNKKNMRIIGICAGVGDSIPERSWPKSQFKDLCEKILQSKEHKVKIILIGTKEDYELNEYIKSKNPNIINTAGKFTLQELFYVMTKIDLFVSNDTGPMHIAAAQGTRTIGLFGPNTPKIWAPYGTKNISIFHPKNGCPYLDNTRHELVPNNLTESQKTCMDAISVDEVYDAVSRMSQSKILRNP